MERNYMFPLARIATPQRTDLRRKRTRGYLGSDLQTGSHRIFASGLRNPVGMAWEPGSGALWVVVNERDELGNDLVPGLMTAVQDGAFMAGLLAIMEIIWTREFTAKSRAGGIGHRAGLCVGVSYSSIRTYI